MVTPFKTKQGSCFNSSWLEMLVSKFLTRQGQFPDILETVSSSLLINECSLQKSEVSYLDTNLNILVLWSDQSQEMCDHPGLVHCHTVPRVLTNIFRSLSESQTICCHGNIIKFCQLISGAHFASYNWPLTIDGELPLSSCGPRGRWRSGSWRGGPRRQPCQTGPCWSPAHNSCWWPENWQSRFLRFKV